MSGDSEAYIPGKNAPNVHGLTGSNDRKTPRSESARKDEFRRYGNIILTGDEAKAFLERWQPIETVERRDLAQYIGFDAMSAEAHGDPQAGVCLITWIEADEDDDEPSGWQVQPFADGLDCIASDTRITHWMPLPSPPEDR